MKHLIKVLIAFCLFGFGIPIQAQNSIPATGGNATGTGGMVSYTIGQVVYTSITGTTGFITQGVQQPFEITVITAIEEASGIILELSVYPNPANDFVILKVKNYESVNLSYKLFSINGTLIQSEKVEGEEIQIPMWNIVSGTCLLKIIDNNKEIKTFKIIKK
jgi:hypothetical protein